MTPELCLADTPEAVDRWSASFVLVDCAAVLDRSSRATVALAGGQTPRGMYRELVRQAPPGFAWHRVEFFFGDERAVPPDSAESNYHLALQELIEPLGIPHSQVHRLAADATDRARAAAEYEALLHSRFDGDQTGFDLMLLGLGTDGHTASLFPGEDPIDSSERWVRSVEAPAGYATRARLTLTPAIINRSHRVMMVATGDAKQAAVAGVLRGDRWLPAARIDLSGDARFSLLVDRAAAGPGATSHPHVTVLP
jgi:6-phosphogluconolactonase